MAVNCLDFIFASCSPDQKLKKAENCKYHRVQIKETKRKAGSTQTQERDKASSKLHPQVNSKPQTNKIVTTLPSQASTQTSILRGLQQSAPIYFPGWVVLKKTEQRLRTFISIGTSPYSQRRGVRVKWRVKTFTTTKQNKPCSYPIPQQRPHGEQ